MRDRQVISELVHVWISLQRPSRARPRKPTAPTTFLVNVDNPRIRIRESPQNRMFGILVPLKTTKHHSYKLRPHFRARARLSKREEALLRASSTPDYPLAFLVKVNNPRIRIRE